ncbi:MAG: ATP-binding cassette domain-containing protein [Desulfurobacteriaceae bacterium]
MKEAIVVKDLKKSFGKKVVHNGVNFTVYDGEIFVIMGPSGTGKSVLLKQIARLIKPDSGKIIVYGMDVLNLEEEEETAFRETLTYVFQSGALFDSLPIWYNVSFYLIEKKGIKEKEAREIAKHYLSLLGLREVEDLFPSELSGGMRKRVAVARALCMNPKCILFDEPTSGLDPVMTTVLDRLILRLRNEFKKTCVVVTHDVNSAFRIADRIAILWNGKVVQIGTPEEIKNSKNKVVKQFISGEIEGPITNSLERNDG